MNGMWYQQGTCGYDDILKRGYPRPKHKTTILVELYSPVTPDFLHGGGEEVPFLVSARARRLIRDNGLTGIRFSSAEVAKIATKAARKRTPKSGEPEDQILKAKDKTRAVVAPELFAVRVTGLLEVIPDYPSGWCPEGNCVSPYEIPAETRMPDLWRPTLHGRILVGWVYCSPRFRDFVIENGLSNIRFKPFEERMAEFRQGVELFQEIRRRTNG